MSVTVTGFINNQKLHYRNAKDTFEVIYKRCLRCIFRPPESSDRVDFQLSKCLDYLMSSFNFPIETLQWEGNCVALNPNTGGPDQKYKADHLKLLNKVEICDVTFYLSLKLLT